MRIKYTQFELLKRKKKYHEHELYLITRQLDNLRFPEIHLDDV
jgi:hypothetical protein